MNLSSIDFVHKENTLYKEPCQSFIPSTIEIAWIGLISLKSVASKMRIGYGA